MIENKLVQNIVDAVRCALSRDNANLIFNIHMISNEI